MKEIEGDGTVPGLLLVLGLDTKIVLNFQEEVNVEYLLTYAASEEPTSKEVASTTATPTHHQSKQHGTRASWTVVHYPHSQASTEEEEERYHLVDILSGISVISRSYCTVQ